MMPPAEVFASVLVYAPMAAAPFFGAYAAAAKDEMEPSAGAARGLRAAVSLAALCLASWLLVRASGAADGLDAIRFCTAACDAAAGGAVRLLDSRGWLIALLFAWSFALGRISGRPWLWMGPAAFIAMGCFLSLTTASALYAHYFYFFDDDVLRGAAGMASLWCLLIAVIRKQDARSRRVKIAGLLAAAVIVCLVVPIHGAARMRSRLYLVFAGHHPDYWRALGAISPAYRASGGVLWNHYGEGYWISPSGELEPFLGLADEAPVFVRPAAPLEATWDEAGRLWVLSYDQERGESSLIRVDAPGNPPRRIALPAGGRYGELSGHGGHVGMMRVSSDYSFCRIDASDAGSPVCETLPEGRHEELMMAPLRSRGLTARIDGSTLIREKPGGGASRWTLPAPAAPRRSATYVAWKFQAEDVFVVPIADADGAVALCGRDGRVRVVWRKAFDPSYETPEFDALPDGTVFAWTRDSTLLYLDPSGAAASTFDLRPVLDELGLSPGARPGLTLLRRAEGRFWIGVNNAYVLVVDERDRRMLRRDRLPPEGAIGFHMRNDAAFFQTARGAWRYDWDGTVKPLMRPASTEVYAN